MFIWFDIAFQTLNHTLQASFHPSEDRNHREFNKVMHNQKKNSICVSILIPVI